MTELKVDGNTPLVDLQSPPTNYASTIMEQLQNLWISEYFTLKMKIKNIDDFAENE